MIVVLNQDGFICLDFQIIAIHFFCDNCVPRGCSCNIRPKDGNWENYNEDNWESELDEQG